MPVVPALSESTVCELNRDLLTRKDDSDKSAQEAYAKILGRVYWSIPFRVNQSENGYQNGHNSLTYDEDQLRDGESSYLDSPVPSTSEPSREVVAEADTRRGLLSQQIIAAKRYIDSIVQTIVAPKVEPQTTFNTHRFQAVSWHKRKHWLAFISGADQVFVYDFEDPDNRDPAVLVNDSQRIVEAVEWRPNSGATLSIACRSGICIWSASFPGNIAPVRAGVVSVTGNSHRGTGVRWTMVDFLKSTDNKPVTAIAWAPCGRLLASASRYGSAITIWEVSQGIGTPLRRGLAGTALLRWSPTGDYLLSAKLNGSFNLWETSKWTSEPWSAVGGDIVSAMWAPDGHVLLAAFDQTTTLGTLYFPSRPPSLDVHLLPLELPEIVSITGGRGSIEKMAWDGTGERLAVSYGGGDATYAGLIAIYDTRHTPIVSVTFLGFIRGPEAGAKPLAFAFHDKLKQGALLAVCWSCGVCCSYPFLFRAH